MHDPAVNNTRITIPAGATTKVALEGTLALSAVSAASTALVSFRKNGATIASSPAQYVQVGAAPYIHAACLATDGVAGDYFEMFCLCSDTSVSINNESNFKLVLLN